MTISIRRLGRGDEPLLNLLATDDADFDIAGRGGDREPLHHSASQRYLENPSVLFWIALDGDTVTGFLSCLLLPLRSNNEQELLLYEIGVRGHYRRTGIGRALLNKMETWMHTNNVDEVWVGADNQGAVSFYRACGFAAADAREFQPVYMTRELSGDGA